MKTGKMTAQRNNPFPPKALEIIKTPILKANTYLKAEAKIIFLCGKRPDRSNPTGRDLVLEYGKKHLKQFKFFLAEDFFEHVSTHGEQDNLDMLTVEEKLTNYSDCIIIILESESTFAELGAFSLKEKTARNIIVINDKKFKKDKVSFISLGPIAKINKESIFKPVIHTDLKSILLSMSELTERLNKIKRIYNKKVNISTYKQFNELQAKLRMLLILDIITFFHPIMFKEIVEILTHLYGNGDFKLTGEISMLLALGLISHCEPYYMRTAQDKSLSYNYRGINEVELRSIIVNHHHKYSRKRISVLLKKISE